MSPWQRQRNQRGWAGAAFQSFREEGWSGQGKLTEGLFDTSLERVLKSWHGAVKRREREKAIGKDFLEPFAFISVLLLFNQPSPLAFHRDPRKIYLNCSYNEETWDVRQCSFAFNILPRMAGRMSNYVGDAETKQKPCPQGPGHQLRGTCMGPKRPRVCVRLC